jgi:hypothetical protein
VVARLRALGYGVPRGPVTSFLEERPELLLSLLAGALVRAGWLLSRFTAIPGEVVAGSHAAAYLAGGVDVARHAWHSLKIGRFDTDRLTVTAALGSAAPRAPSCARTSAWRSS